LMVLVCECPEKPKNGFHVGSLDRLIDFHASRHVPEYIECSQNDFVLLTKQVSTLHRKPPLELQSAI
jgi:hypothetical protein